MFFNLPVLQNAAVAEGIFIITRPWKTSHVRMWCTRNHKFYKLLNFIIFLISNSPKQVFHFLSTWRNFKTLGVHILYNTMYARFVKPTMCCIFISCFIFILQFGMLLCTLFMDFMSDLQWSSFSTFKWDKPLMEKLEL